MKFIVTALLALVAGNTKADGLKVSDLTLNLGAQTTMEVNLEQEAVKYAGLQFDLTLPSGVSLVGDQLIAAQTGDMVCQKRELADGTVRFVVYSPTLSATKAGAVVALRLKADKSARKGSRQLRLKSVILTDAEGVVIRPEDATAMVTVAAPVKVTAQNISRVYGDENGELAYEISESSIGGQPTITCEATPTSPIGRYDIVVGKGTLEADTVTLAGGRLTVTRAPLTITAKSYTRKQGEENPVLEVVYDGLKNGETAEVLTRQPSVSCTARASSAPGEYDITVRSAQAANYDITYVAGKLTVTEADPVTVTAKSYSRYYGEANPTLEYEVSGAALNGEPTLSCSATAKSPVGTYPITIKKGTVKNYNDAYMDGVLTILPAPLTVTAQSYTRKQGEANPGFAVSYEGWKNNETTAVLTKQPTIVCEATEASEPGEYDITVDGAEAANYAISYVVGKLTVTEADAVKVTAKSYTREYGEQNPTFAYDVEGAALDGEPVIECEATAASPVGEYPITIKKGGVKNYNDSYVDGVLTITKAVLTVKADSVSREQGTENPVLTVTYSGWKLSDDESVLTKQPVATTAATTYSPVGQYPVTVSGGEAENYMLVYKDGVLTVTIPSSISSTTASEKPFDVWTTAGLKVRSQVTTLKGLPAGVYIVNGQKTVVK